MSLASTTSLFIFYIDCNSYVTKSDIATIPYLFSLYSEYI